MPAHHPNQYILSINGGSSSLKFALFRRGNPPIRIIQGMADRIGLDEGSFTISFLESGEKHSQIVQNPSHHAALDIALHHFSNHLDLRSIGGVGHRLVHGGPRNIQHTIIDTNVLDELRRVQSFAPDHLPAEINLITGCMEKLPDSLQAGCFDTAFHHSLSPEAMRFPIPSRYFDQGIRRYGFHGLSYESLMEQLLSRGVQAAREGRIILAHLGNGASMAAIKAGSSIDTTMGFTPSGGLVMSRRSGDLDPGVLVHIMRTEGLSVDTAHHLVHHESGLLGISGITSDVRQLLAMESKHLGASQALASFCHSARKHIGALAAGMGGVDALAFAGGIGENSPEIRKRILTGLEFLGISLDDSLNRDGNSIITRQNSRVMVYLLRTDEENVIARITSTFMTSRAGQSSGAE